MTIGRSDIERLIPHAGAMCLLDGVIRWDDASIVCVSGRHRDPDNPLRNRGRLGVLSGVEFAAQAMAAHGRLAGGVRARPRTGYMVSLRDVVCGCERLDLVTGNLIVEAERVMGDDDRATYRFVVRGDARDLLSGRATVVLDVIPS